MAIPNSAFSEMVVTTLRHVDKSIIDNVTEHNALLRFMKERGNIKKDYSGGYEIQMNLSYQENETYQRYHGGDVLNTADSDVLSAAKYDYKQSALHVTATGRELKLNNGREKMKDLVKSRVEVAMATAANNMSVDIYSDGTASNQIGGLEHLVTDDGTGTVGGINAGTYTFWKNQFQEMSDPTTFSALKADMNSLWLKCVNGTDKPDICVLSHDLYTVYEGGLQDLQRYGDTKAAGMGFEALKYKSASVIFDDNSNFGTTSETGYFLNTKHLYLMQHPDADWKEGESKTPVNQDKIVIPLYWMGNMATNQRRLQGKLIDNS